MSQTYGVEKDGEHVGLVTWAFLTVLRMLVDLMTWGMLLNKLGETLAADSLLIDVKDGKSRAARRTRETLVTLTSSERCGLIPVSVGGAS
jgi:hypothetical protein